MLTTQEATASRWRPLAIGATAAVALAFTTGRTDVECGAIKQPRACNPTPGCGFWEICFKNAEDYIAAYKRGDVVHCRSIKDEMRGVRIIRVSSAPDICLSGWASSAHDVRGQR
jgi:hypothetical protein